MFRFQEKKCLNKNKSKREEKEKLLILALVLASLTSLVSCVKAVFTIKEELLLFRLFLRLFLCTNFSAKAIFVSTNQSTRSRFVRSLTKTGGGQKKVLKKGF